MEVSLTGELADACLVIRECDREIGMITVVNRSDCGRIGLMAVAPDERRNRVAGDLVHAALDHMIDHDCRSAEVVTH